MSHFFEHRRYCEMPKPVGSTALVSYLPWCGERTVVDYNMRVAVDASRPWLARVWESLTAKVPSPQLAMPLCCYVNTVIFYVWPYRTRPWHRISCWRGKYEAAHPGDGFEEWGRVESRLVGDGKCWIDGVEYRIEGGTVLWHEKRWWMYRRMRRVQPRGVPA